MQVVNALRIVSSESTVFCTIHQPGMDIYNIFTHVLLLSDGKTGYFGSLKDATKFFLRYLISNYFFFNYNVIIIKVSLL